MKAIEIIFWCSIAVIFYTYIGYGVLLWILVKIKELLHKPFPKTLPAELPEVTLFITAYNEEKVVDDKMANCYKLAYPKEKLHIVWVTDGSNDNTNEKLSHYPDVAIFHTSERKGKTAAMTRGMQYINTPITIFTDANTTLNQDAISEIVKEFSDKKVGCVAGEKRISVEEKANAASGGEGIYWKYESALKALDYRLYSAVGAAGELFAVRTSLFEDMPADTLLDDFILSLRIAQKGYKIAYCSSAYAVENGSANMKEEQKRKIRIAAGGLQSIARLSSLMNIFRYGTLSFQYISHRVLRWSLTPVLLFLLIPLNIWLALDAGTETYRIILLLQCLFYASAWLGAYLAGRQIKVKILFIPYYFTFMNLNVLRAFFYLSKHKGQGTWAKSERA